MTAIAEIQSQHPFSARPERKLQWAKVRRTSVVQPCVSDYTLGKGEPVPLMAHASWQRFANL
jgi:hypothetical protein